MGASRLSLKRVLLVTTFIALCLFATTVRAQGNEDTTAAADATTTESNDDSEATTTADSNDDSEETTTADSNDDEETTTTAKDDTETATSTDVSITATATGSTTADTASSSIPSITGTTAPDSASSNLPSLTGIYNTYSYPAASVPPTSNAPFMQTSSLPDGTVFIAVGAILGAFGAAILIWRGIVACLLHRSVERAAVAQHATNDKAFPAPPAQFYKYSDQESKVSLAGIRRTNRGPIPSGTPSQTNLFFSPTAPGQGHQSRDSRASFLPNGFYPANAGGSSPLGGPGGHGHSISLTNLRPSSRGQVASYVGPSPPDSPAFGPNRSNPAMRNVSTSSLNRPPSQRAPSAYLEDLLDENPHMLPPQGDVPPMPPQHGHGQGRY
ncbi:uncharacterized protein MKZ38_001734 [Zalerion maritima]|uniref:Uncharacterized protein n=1 Tax=Zalerion maritima TaxID=339359 RepID=A0AAD5WR98_9PEZI|nr:uncharacterized protein MKZ38_001734 [Zalerion maritima]